MVKKWYKKLFHKLKSRFDKQFDNFSAHEGKNQRRPFIIPAKFGMYFGSGILVLLLLAFTYANQLIYLVAFFFGSFLFVVMHLTNNNIKSLRVENYSVSSTFLEVTPKIYITLKNEHKKYFARYIQIQLDNKQRRVVEELKPEESKVIVFDYPVKERGIVSYPKINISTTFPFGLFYSWKRVQWKNHFLVYPKRQGEQALPYLNKNSESEALNSANKMLKSQDGEFIMHKEFNSNDNYKRIDWRVFARKNKLYTKVYNEDESQAIYIDIEKKLKDSTEGSFEKRLSQITKWINECQKNNFHCLVKIPNQALQLPETPHEFELIYEYLALVKNETKESYGS